jgi:sugar/nucleoside kinase (ribokinase family)
VGADTRFDLLVIGDVNPDVIVASADLDIQFGQHESFVDDGCLALGGSAAITACGAARLGLRTAFVAVVGDDALGHICRDLLQQSGVDVSMLVVDPAVRTGLTVLLQQSDDRAILTYGGSIRTLSMRHVPAEALKAARHVHVGSYFLLDGLRPALPELFATLHARGQTTSLDTNFDPAERWDAGAVLDECDVLLPSATEACRLAGVTALGDALDRLAARVPIVVATDGAAGAVAARGNDRVRVDAAPVAGGIIDAIGAGDTFDAGFLYGFLNTWDLERSIRLAVGAAALSLRGRGGTERQGTLAEALDSAGLTA